MPSTTAEDAAKSLQDEIAALQKKVADSAKARSEAEAKAKELAQKLAEAENASPFAALCKCLSGGSGASPAPAAAKSESTGVSISDLRLSMEPELKVKIKKAMKEFCNADSPKPLLEQGVDSLALQSLTTALAKETGVSEQVLTEKVAVVDDTTAAMLIDKVIEIAVEVAKTGGGASTTSSNGAAKEAYAGWIDRAHLRLASCAPLTALAWLCATAVYATALL